MKFWDINTSQPNKVKFTTDELTICEEKTVSNIVDYTILKQNRWLALASPEGLLSLDIDELGKRDDLKEWNTVSD